MGRPWHPTWPPHRYWNLATWLRRPSSNILHQAKLAVQTKSHQFCCYISFFFSAAFFQCLNSFNFFSFLWFFSYLLITVAASLCLYFFSLLYSSFCLLPYISFYFLPFSFKDRLALLIVIYSLFLFQAGTSPRRMAQEVTKKLQLTLYCLMKFHHCSWST